MRHVPRGLDHHMQFGASLLGDNMRNRASSHRPPRGLHGLHGLPRPGLRGSHPVDAIATRAIIAQFFLERIRS